MPSLESRKIGDLHCHVISTSQAPQLTAVFCHGFGAPGDDLVPLGAQLLRVCSSLTDRVQIVFPTAPLSLSQLGMPGARAWWMIDTNRLVNAVNEGRTRELQQEVPAGLASAREALRSTVAALQAENGLGPDRLVLGGFSQGAMVTTDLALRMDHSPAALVIWSGALICRDEWASLAPNRSGLTVVQSHGRQDPILAFSGATDLRDLLVKSGMDVDFLDFSGPHTIPFDALTAAGRLCERLLDQP